MCTVCSFQQYFLSNVWIQLAETCAHFQSCYKSLLCSFLKQHPNLKKAGRCHVTTDLWSSGQSITCLSQHFGQLSNTNSSPLPGSQRSTMWKLASLCTREVFLKDPCAGDAFPVWGCGMLPSLGLFSSRDSALCSTDCNTRQGIHTCPRIRSLNTWITHMVMWNN